MPLAELDASTFRNSVGATLDRVLAGERVILTRHGRRAAVLVPVADLDALDALARARDVEGLRRPLAGEPG
jgi:prevent-host-death family protein